LEKEYSYKVWWMTQSFLKEIFEYKDDVLVWKERPVSHFTREPDCRTFNTKRLGKPISKGRSITLTYCGEQVKFKIHCLVYLYHYGYLPAVVDHIDSDKFNHKLSNLQPATNQLNTAKASMFSHNTSGYRGVHPCTRNNRLKWKTEIKVFGEKFYIGRYDNIHYAGAVYNAVASKLFGKYAFENKSKEIDKIDVDIGKFNTTFFRVHLPRLMQTLEEIYGEHRDKIPDRD